MADLDEIRENPREAGNEGSGPETDGDPVTQNRTKRKRSRRRRNSGRSQASAQSPPAIQDPGEGREEDENREQNAQQQSDGQVFPVPEEDHQAQFYEGYRKVAEEYDKEFLKKHGEDLDTTLIFAGLFSAVTSAFIIDVNSQLKPDPGDETAALLRVLIYKVDSSTFGGNVPALPQWTGPPRAMVDVQAILFASLSASLFSALLAMLGKQWLNRYASTDMRGTAIERIHNRQRKQDGLVAWYFNSVMESLPLMLQVALLLLGCALSRYLWEVDVTVASVVVGVTSLGLIFYIFVVVAGAIWESCPYQTPGSRALRYVWSIPHSVVTSRVVLALLEPFEGFRAVRWFLCDVMVVGFLLDLVCITPFVLITGIFQLGRAIFRASVAFPARAHHFVRNAYSLFRRTPSTSGQESNHQMTRLNLGCISWTLHVSLDKDVHLSTLKHLLSIPELADFDPTLVLDCFRIFTGCVNADYHRAVIAEGLEELAISSAGGFLRTLLRLFVTDPTSRVLADLRRSYAEVFLTFHYGSRSITDSPPPVKHLFLTFVRRSWSPREVWRDHDRPSSQESNALARDIARVAVTYRWTYPRKVPRWILRVALHYLSLDPPLPPSAIANCLQVVAIDLGCDISDITTVDESARVEQVSSRIIREIRNMTASAPPNDIFPKRKAVSTLLPYAIHLGQGGQQEMVDVILSAAGTSGLWKFVWGHVGPYFATLFDKPSPPSLDHAITLLSPHVSWKDVLHGEAAIANWGASASAVPYSEEVGQSVADVLLQIASVDSLRPLIPVDVWAWLKKRPILPPFFRECDDRCFSADVIEYVRGLGDLEILKSYFLLVWSEWPHPSTSPCSEFEVSIREDFDGTEKWHHREDLVKRLDHLLAYLNRGPEYFQQYNLSVKEDWVRWRREQYEELRDLVLEVDRKAMETLDLSRSCPNFTCALPLPCP